MIKRKRKKNPENFNYNKFRSLLYDVISSGSPIKLTNVITYYKQGELCHDCGKYYHGCECEKCLDCNYRRCLCDLNVDKSKYLWLINNDFETENEFDYFQQIENKIKKVGWELAKLLLSKSDLVILRSNVNYSSSEEALEKVKIPKIDMKWLESK